MNDSRISELIFRDAPLVANTYMSEGFKAIDEVFGKDFAKNNPTLLAAYMMTAALHSIGGEIHVKEFSEPIKVQLDEPVIVGTGEYALDVNMS